MLVYQRVFGLSAEVLGMGQQHEAADIPNLVHSDRTNWKITMLFRGKLTFPMTMAFNSKLLAITISGRRMSFEGIKGFDLR